MCTENYLDLNVKKTKELLIDFRRNPEPVPELTIKGIAVERVNEYKYLGTVLDDKLNFNANTNHIFKKCQTRIYCLQKLRILEVNQSILQTFYRFFIESVITFGCMCWFGGLNVENKNVIAKVVKVCSKTLGEGQKSMNELYECRVKRKALSVCGDESHVLARCYNLLPSGRRYRAPKVKTLRYRNSFVPKSISILNKS